MKISFNLSEDRAMLLECSTKQEALTLLIDKLSAAKEVGDANELRLKVFEREQLMSTGIGMGIAVPHVRLASVTNVVLALGICKLPLHDYETLDDVPVRIVCMIAANSEQHNEYIQTLATISKLLKQESLRKALLEAKNGADIHRIFTASLG
jgi:PTS system nitrogen regulatory IIA component